MSPLPLEFADDLQMEENITFVGNFSVGSINYDGTSAPRNLRQLPVNPQLGVPGILGNHSAGNLLRHQHSSAAHRRRGLRLQVTRTLNESQADEVQRCGSSHTASPKLNVVVSHDNLASTVAAAQADVVVQ